MAMRAQGSTLIFSRYGETVQIEPWGQDALRVRATMQPHFSEERWALTEEIGRQSAEIEIETESCMQDDGSMGERPRGSIRNGRIRAEIDYAGNLCVYDGDRILLWEDSRDEGTLSPHSRALKIRAREWKGLPGATQHALTVRFSGVSGEMLFGMGQYQQSELDLCGCVLELAQRNSQVSVPFLVSSVGYGFLWNNPSVGQVVFGTNLCQWTARATKDMDWWITAADTPAKILENYTAVTGRPGAFPDELTGLWQCKLRYRTQEEVLEVARRYRDLGRPLSAIIIDFFHWTVQGDWDFDRTYWPDPAAMVAELHEMGTRVMVSVWPTVDRRSKNFRPMLEEGLLMRTESGALQTYDYQGDCVEVDMFNPRARRYIFEECMRSYGSYGFDGYWLDNAEPDLTSYDFEHYRYSAGPALEVSNMYPLEFSRAFYEGMKEISPDVPVVNLVRSGWAGSQKYGNVIWSGDVPSSFASFQDQVQCGLNMGMAGIPWWTTDIGGFMTEDAEDPEFRELLIRWFQYAVYTPVLRMHGNRGPHNIPPLDNRVVGGGYLFTGHPNEIWSFGPECETILRSYLDVREALRPYIAKLFDEAHRTGAPLMRPMFFEFPDDPQCWVIDDAYMFGSEYLVAPILSLGKRERTVYLPADLWRDTRTGAIYVGDEFYHIDAPLEYMPVLQRVWEDGLPAL